MTRRVTAEELEPNGWTCEACGEPFEEGDEVYGNALAMTEHESEPASVEGEYRCAVCFHLDHKVA